MGAIGRLLKEGSYTHRVLLALSVNTCALEKQPVDPLFFAGNQKELVTMSFPVEIGGKGDPYHRGGNRVGNSVLVAPPCLLY